jgi:hypothetical protein
MSNPCDPPPRTLPAGDDEHAVYCREQGFPWCDTCKAPAVVDESTGWRHTSVEFPFGSSRFEETFDHTVTAHEWWQS